MSGKPELSTVDIERGLRALGFNPRPQKATSHIQWIYEDKERNIFRKVTLDPHHSPFSDDLIASMARQAEVTKNQFYEVCSKTGQKAVKKGILRWAAEQFPRFD